MMPKPGKETRKEHWTKLTRTTLEEPAWRALSPVAQALYPWLKFEWHGPDFNNNGKISLSVRQAANRLGVSLNTAARGFHDLQAKGFIVIIEMARLGSVGNARSATYELTELALPYGEKRGGRQLYKQWRQGNDYPVCRARANNPKGVNGKTNSHHLIEECGVINFETCARKASQK